MLVRPASFPFACCAVFFPDTQVFHVLSSPPRHAHIKGMEARIRVRISSLSSCRLTNMSLSSSSTVSLTSMSGTFLAALASIDEPEYMAVRQAHHFCVLWLSVANKFDYFSFLV